MPTRSWTLFFKENRDYVERLQAIGDDGAREDWLAFFVDGIGAVAEEATGWALEIVQLRDDDQRLIAEKLGKRARMPLRSSSICSASRS